MNSEYFELWDTMKSTVHSKTREKLTEIIRGSEGNLLDVMDTALNVVCVAMHAAVGTLWYLDSAGDGLIHPKAAFGGNDISGVTLHPGEGIAGQVILKNEAAVISDCQSDPRWAGEIASGSSFTTKTMICVPLSDGESAYGCIQFINKVDDTLFDERDSDLAVKLAELVSEEFNICRYKQTPLWKAQQAAKALQTLCDTEPEILQAALKQMPGYSDSAWLKNGAAFSLLKRLIKKLK